MKFSRNFRFGLYASAAMAALAAPMAVEAQEIASGVRGQIVNEQGDAVAGVRVIITHVPTGARSVQTTNNSGAYYARNLRPGGPYRVEVVGTDAYAGQRFDNITLTVAQPLTLNMALSAGSAVEEIAITAQRVQNVIRGGGATSYGVSAIEELPSVSRDFKDLIRQNPFVQYNRVNSSISIVGNNNKLNSITVNGLAQNDTFGLNNSGVPTQRSPISIDAIEQVGVSPAPFDVENGEFQGGLINIVTKSGTNEFHGSVFYQYRDDSLVGDEIEGNEFDLGDFENEFYGGTFGGPIIKDKLFFFANYEKFERTTPNNFGTADSGRPNSIDGVTNADVARIRDIAASRYGFNLLGTELDNISEEDEKYYFQIDWNVSDSHRLMASYQRTDGNALVLTGNSRSRDQLADESHFYDRSELLEAYNLQFYSDWSDNFSTEVKFGYTEQTTGQVSRGSNFAHVIVETPGGGEFSFGPDEFRHANELKNETYQFKFQGDYLTGDHNISFGYEFNRQEVFNLFVPTSFGLYEFASIDDFENGIVDAFEFTNAPSGNPADGAGEFEVDRHTAYIQDSWDVNGDLTVTAGLRFEYTNTGEAPALNPFFVERNGFANTKTLDGHHILLPRLSFKYQLDDDNLIRGGVGLFSGGDPLVFISNNFSVDGVTVGSLELGRGSDPALVEQFLNNPNLGQVPAAALGLITSSPESTVNAIDPDFALPSTWRFNLAYERFQDLGFLGDDWHLTAELIASEVKDALTWRELRRRPVGVAPDGSPIYPRQGGDDILLTNTSQGNSVSVAFSAQKSWDHWDFSASYTFTDSENVNERTSSRASSNFEFIPHLDRNNLVLGTSQFETRHNINLALTYRNQFWGDNDTIVSLYYNGRSGRPFSFTFDEFLQFGGTRDADAGDSHLLYVPTANEVGILGVDDSDPTKTVLLDGVTVSELDSFIEEFDLERGRSVGRNDRRSSFVDLLDLRVSQEVPTGFGKIEFWMDMENVLNFVDSDWGNILEPSFPTVDVVDVRVSDFDGVNKFIFTGINNPRLSTRVNQSLWRVQFGVKWKF